MYDRKVIFKLNRIKAPTLPTKFGCIVTVKRQLRTSFYENTHTHCGVVPQRSLMIKTIATRSNVETNVSAVVEWWTKELPGKDLIEFESERHASARLDDVNVTWSHRLSNLKQSTLQRNTILSTGPMRLK